MDKNRGTIYNDNFRNLYAEKKKSLPLKAKVTQQDRVYKEDGGISKSNKLINQYKSKAAELEGKDYLPGTLDRDKAAIAQARTSFKDYCDTVYDLNYLQKKNMLNNMTAIDLKYHAFKLDKLETDIKEGIKAMSVSAKNYKYVQAQKEKWAKEGPETLKKLNEERKARLAQNRVSKAPQAPKHFFEKKTQEEQAPNTNPPINPDVINLVMGSLAKKFMAGEEFAKKKQR